MTGKGMHVWAAWAASCTVNNSLSGQEAAYPAQLTLSSKKIFKR